MANETVGKLIYEVTVQEDGSLTGTLKKSNDKIKELGKEAEKTENKMSKMSKGIFTASNAIKGYILGMAGSAIKQMIQEGATLDSLQLSYERMAKQRGMVASETVRQMEEVSRGTIALSDIFQSANKAMALGVAKDTQDMTELMQVAVLKGAEMGITTRQAFDDIVTGIGRASPLILDNLGIVIDSEGSQISYAKSIGKTVEQLTKEERAQAIKYEVMRDGMKDVQRAGVIQLSYAQRIEQSNKFITDFIARTGQAFLPSLESIQTSIGDVSANTQESIQKFDFLGETLYRTTFFMKMVGGILAGLGLGVYALGNAFLQGGKVAWAYAMGLYKVFKGLKENATSFGEGLNLLFSGKVKDSLKVFKKSFTNSTKGAFSELSIAFKDAKTSMADYNAIFYTNMDNIGANAKKFATGNGYVSAIRAINDNAQGGVTPQNDLADAIGGVGEASDKSKKATEELAKASEEYKEKLIDVVDKIKETSKALNEDLNEAVKKFNEEIGKDFEDTNTSLAKVVIEAENKKKELSQKLSEESDQAKREEIEKEIRFQEDILSRRAGFEKRQKKLVEEIREKLETGGVDTTSIDNLLKEQDFKKTIDDERKLSQMNAFDQEEELQKRRLIKLADNLIAEVGVIKSKVDQQKALETELTAFIVANSGMRKEAVEQFANNAIAKYGAIADSLRNVISLQSRLTSTGGGAVPQFHTGGFVGAKGGQVHAGEYVIPKSMVSSLGGLVGSLESMRTGGVNTVNTPVTINSSLSKEMSAKELSAILGFELNKYIR